jgi:hypothetical protein
MTRTQTIALVAALACAPPLARPAAAQIDVRALQVVNSPAAAKDWPATARPAQSGTSPNFVWTEGAPAPGGEGFAFGAGWDLPQTPATRAVASALARGLCAAPAVDFLNASGQKAALALAPNWPADHDLVMWYGKGDGCDGKFQYVVPDPGGWSAGWEIKWDRDSWVAGVGAPGVPYDGATNTHPTKWRFEPFPGQFVPPPIVTPPPPIVTPPPPIVTPPPIPTNADYTVLLQQILASEAALLDAQRQSLDVEKDTNAQVHEMNRTIGQTLGAVAAFLGKYVAPAVGGWLVAKGASK